MARRVEAITARRVPLSKERVLHAAIGLADQGGIDSLTMRRLAQELGVEAMSLYHYVSSKDDILDGISRHPWAAKLIMSGTGVGLARVRYMDAVLRRLREAGFSPELTHHAYHALDSHIMGSTLWAAAYATMPKAQADLAQNFLRKLPLTEYPDFAEHAQQHIRKTGPKDKSEFEFGLDLILDGLERVRDAARPSASVRRRTPRTLRDMRRPKRQ
ncbi:MAG: TetR/AcrR family transcriptional regulator [Chloroflexi bacterium]|nr:MAG: TetR/AcrR family transcriptional regulator [Chloroflexota bacterium]